MKLKKEIQKKLAELLTADCYKDYELQLGKLAAKLGLQVFDATFTDPKLSGAIYKDETGTFGIYVNEHNPVTRKRFTAAHEIGHYISAICGSYSEKQLFQNNGEMEDYAVSYRTKGDDSAAEIEANQIAAQMLMPEAAIRKFIEDGTSIEKIADIFFVSQQAVAIRMNNLEIDIL